MNIGASLRVAWSSLKANKVRSLLTMLGVIIGVMAVIVVVAIGEGLKTTVLENIGRLGTNLLIVRPGQVRGVPGRSGRLTIEDVEALRKDGKFIAMVVPELTTSAQVKYRSLNHTTQVVGTSPQWQFVRNYQIEAGRFINEGDMHSRAAVCVLGSAVADELFFGRPMLDVTIKIRRASFRVVGIFREKGGGGFMNPDDVVVIPLSTAQTRLRRSRNLNSINVSATAAETAEKAKDSITAVLRRRHRLRPGEPDDFRIMTQSEMLETIARTGAQITLFLGGIALVSLLVGGVGIMNIMLVSVTERTREIGVRKAVGAKPRDILLQFLIESVVLSVVGGCIGVVLGAGVSYVLGSRFSFGAQVSPLAILVAFIFSVVVGVFFGIYPARKAARLHPIAALRYE